MGIFDISHENANSLKTNCILEFPGINDVEDKLRTILEGARGVTSEMCMNLLESGGKRLRPLLVMYCGLCFSDITVEMVDAAAAAELIHMASLVHDDIIDNSGSRRGRRTINSLYGNHGAVLAGDYLFAKAFSILSSEKLLKSMEYLVYAIQEMCDGEINQADDFFNTSLTRDDYFRRIEKKTAALIASCCMAGAAAAGAPDEYMDIMKQYGVNIGYTFQIIDDILDFTGDSVKLGKPTGMDIMQGNITLPVIILMEDPKYGHHVRKILSTGKVNESELEAICGMLSESGSVKKAFKVAEKCSAKAKASVYSIPDSFHRAKLLDIADMVINRER